MKENKGFTLIELLAVIVILAIIALIATPVIMNIINSSRKSAAQESAKLMIAELRLAYNEASLEAQSNSENYPTIAAVIDKFSADGVENTNNAAGTVTDSFGTTCTISNASAITCSGSKLDNNITSTETFEFAS